MLSLMLTFLPLQFLVNLIAPQPGPKKEEEKKILIPTGSQPLNGAQNHGCVYLQACNKTAVGALRTAYSV